MKYIFRILLGIFLVGLSACKKDKEPTTTPDPLADLNLPSTPFDYAGTTFPAHFTQNDFPARYQFQYAAIEADNTPADNAITNEGALLGRVLFYEKKLSADGTVACASCHDQAFGFADPETFSNGIQGGVTRRHSMSLTNARFYETGKFFWDERAATLEEQVLMPFQDPVEMGLSLQQLIEIVEQQAWSEKLFTDAFGDGTVTADRISKALAQFVRSMVSFEAKYDEGRAQVASALVDFPNFTAQENLGKQIFHDQNLAAPSCNGCHMSEAFTAPKLSLNSTTSGTNNGLDASSTTDLGIFESSGNNGHRGKFKVPSLRNIEMGSPFMHDGRFKTLEQVIDHYSTGIQNHPTLTAFLRDGNGIPIKYNFTAEQKAALVAFLRTLTDNKFLTDEKFRDPFK